MPPKTAATTPDPAATTTAPATPPAPAGEKTAEQILADADALAAGGGPTTAPAKPTVQKLDDAPSSGPAADPERDPRRNEGILGQFEDTLDPAVRSSLFDTMDRLGDRLRKARSLGDFVGSLKSAVREFELLVKDPAATAPLAAGYKEEQIEVPGEGTFTVRRNGWDPTGGDDGKGAFRPSLGNVELKALVQISGTGIQAGDDFALPSDQAVSLVLRNAASPRQLGGVRRSKPVQPAGEQAPPAT